MRFDPWAAEGPCSIRTDTHGDKSAARPPATNFFRSHPLFVSPAITT